MLTEEAFRVSEFVRCVMNSVTKKEDGVEIGEDMNLMISVLFHLRLSMRLSEIGEK